MTLTSNQAINAAALYVSQHRNGIAKLCPTTVKRALGSARDILSRQLTALRDILSGSYEGNKEGLAENAYAVCLQYFTYTESIARSVWEAEFRKFPPQSLVKHPLYAAALKGPEAMEAALIALADKRDSDAARVEAFIARLVVGKALFIEAARSIGGESAERETIIRTIVFGPEFKQAGISILSYFSEIVARKYPDLDVGVKIEQQGSKVTLIIETPSGEIEKIEQELGNYGLVVTGKLPVSGYIQNPVEAMMLTQKLEMAHMEIRHTKELLYTERAGHEKRIQSLESEIEFMRAIFDKTQYQNEQTTQAIRQLAIDATSGARETLGQIVELLAQDGQHNQQLLNSYVTSLRKQSPGIISQLNELFVKGSIQGAAGNYLYAALTAIQRLG
ncbi:hypothetical protein J2X20_003276 [Pelomonas saccharophila]|uniref:Uncharacterized protein n=1 Tax=Roseateles saccharophilus TaxID=304 RepID=A0ABU1YP28_ROSSA|nr:hypothetical protein [Roseateles saccharophilus]MDR7270618.1 hypothetical protein [Roseateles saccharophilus]